MTKRELIAFVVHAIIISFIVGCDIWGLITGLPPTWTQIVVADIYILFWSWALVIMFKEDI